MSRYVIILAALSLLAPLDGRPPKQTASKKIVKTTAQKQVSAKPAVDPEQEIYQWFRTCAEIVSTIKDKALRNVEYKNFFNHQFEKLRVYIEPKGIIFKEKQVPYLGYNPENVIG